jgi:glucose/arabinose dehydrogenase
MRPLFAAIIILACWQRGSILAASLDTNFTQTVFTPSAGTNISGMAWAADGSDRLFVIGKEGTIGIVKNGTLLPTPFATLSPIFLDSECGLLGICFDPNFMLNGYVYVFVTVSSSEQQIIRYRAIGNLGTDKTVLIPGLPTHGQYHDGGAVGVGADGKLYWGIGDTAGFGGNADLTSLSSKIGRANLDGTVPADNPFVDGLGGNNDYIWARGFRNPFTLTFQPTTGDLWVNDVGTLYEQIFQVKAGDHAGWTDYENNQPAGFITPKIKYNSGGMDTRNLLSAAGAVRLANTVTFTTTATHGFRQGEKITIAGVTDPGFNGAFFVASVPSATTFTAAQIGADASSGGGTATTIFRGYAVLGGCFYDSTAVPAAYRENFFFGDLVSGYVMRAILTASNDVVWVDTFADGVNLHIKTCVGPDGALYSVGYYDGRITRLAYNFSAQQLVVTPTILRMFEGGAAAISIRLAQAPPANLQVSVNRTAGDTNISVAAGNSLTFGTANWSIPQVATVMALADRDTTNSTASLTISAAGLPSETVTIHALDLPPRPFSIRAVALQAGATPVAIELMGEPGRTYVLEASTNLTSPWTPLATNALSDGSTNFTDTESSTLSRRFYRARLLP